MRSGSPANDGGGWPSAQRPHPNEALGNQGRHASGARGEPRDGTGPGRRDVPFGPDISWPYGFRQLDPESREVLESAYGTGPGYQQPVMDDFGYGDPGYSDPSYEGPKTPYGNPAFPADHGASHGNGRGTPRDAGGTGYRPSGGGVAGYQLPEVRDPSPSGRQGSARQGPGYPAPGRQPQPFARSSGRGDEIWPVTGAQEALPDQGQWHGSPRLDDRAPGDSRPSRSADPRLAGMTYGELRYDDPEPGESSYDEPLDDESWYQELRRNAPAFPQSPGDPQGPGGGPQRRAFPAGSDGSGRRLPQRAGRPAYPARRYPGGLPAGRRHASGRPRGQPAAGVGHDVGGDPDPGHPPAGDGGPPGNRDRAAGPRPGRPGDHLILARPARARGSRLIPGLLAGRRGRGIHRPVR